MRLHATKLGSIANSRGFGDQLANLAGQVPGLDLNFAQNKSLIDDYSGTSLVTFTRASTGTYVGADGLIKSATTDEARFDHNPATGESLGLLVEEAGTNLVRNNTMVGAVAGSPGTPPTNGWSIANNATYASSIIGTGIENGINYIDIQYVIAAGAAASGGIIYPDTPAATASTAYTGSFYIKLVSGTSPQARFVWQDNVSTYNRTLFDLTSTLTRYTDTLTTAVGASLARLAVGFAASPSGATFVIRIGMPQVEEGAFATSVIPTTSATVTRAADVATITGTNFSSWYNQTEGTVFGQFLRTASTNTQQGRVFSFSDGTNTNVLEIYHTGPSNPAAQINVSTLQAQWTPSGFTVGTSIKEVLGYKLNNSNASFNGSAETLDTVCNIPTVTQARIGDRQDGVRTLNGTIQRLTYWPVRLPDPTLQSITTP